MRDRRESGLLLAILRRRWEEAGRIVRGAPASPGIFLDLCRQCGVVPAVHSLLAQADQWDLTGPEVREGLTSLKRDCRIRNLRLLAATGPLADLLREHDIIPVALRGLDVLHRFHAMFDQRDLGDVDLLVHPGQADLALEALRASGYVESPDRSPRHGAASRHRAMFATPGPESVQVEIQWSLGPGMEHAAGAEEVLERAVPLEIEGRKLRRLEDHDAAAHLLLHHAGRWFPRRLKWMLDLLRLAEEPGFDWNTLAWRIGALRATTAAGMTILHIRKLFPERIPQAATDALPAPAMRRLLTLPLRTTHPLDFVRLRRWRLVQRWIEAAVRERSGTGDGTGKTGDNDGGGSSSG